MISLNDVLLAMSNIPVDDPIAEIWGRGLQGGYKIIKYTGSLPIAINANGDAMLDYRIYGTDGGVGEPTENLFSGEFSQFNNVGGTGNTYAYFYIPEDFTLTLVAKDPHVVPNYVYLGITKDGGQNTSGVTWLIYNNKNVKEGDIFTVKSSINGYHCVSMYINSDSALLWILEHYYVMLNLGSTAPASYIPYGYKLPIVSSTENLFDRTGEISPYYIDKAGKINQIAVGKWFVSDFTPVQPNTTYTFTCNSLPGSDAYHAFYNDNKELISTVNMRIFTFTTPNDAKYMRFTYRGGSFDIMLTLGSTAPTSYIPYSRTDTPVYIGENQLDSVEGVADYVDKSSGKIVRMIGEYTFTGDENIQAFGLGFYTPTISNANSTSDLITIRFSHFTARYNTALGSLSSKTFGDNCGCFRANYGNILLRSSTNFTTVDECNAYLKSQYDNGTPVKMWYIMETPIEEDPPVPFPEIPTIDGETVIDYDGDPKPSQMYIKYKGKG